MAYKKLLVSLVAILALTFAIANVSADFADISSVKVNGVSAVGGSANVGVFAGDTLPVEVQFKATQNASDVRLKVWLSGSSDYAVSSDRFDIIAGSTYNRLVAVQVPANIDPTEGFSLEISLESKSDGIGADTVVNLAAQRESYNVEILDVNMDNQVEAGNTLALDVVLKNRGSHEVTDTFVKVTIPALGVEQKSYFGDMTPVDMTDDSNKQDASERSMTIKVPSNAKPGVYVVNVEAYNSDSDTVLTKKLAIVGASEDSLVISSVDSKTFAAGEDGSYTMTLVNSGNKIKVYELIVESSDENLNVNVDEPVVAVPAGSSKTVRVVANAAKAGKYNFAVNVQSNGDFVKKESFVANVQGSSAGNALSGNTAIVLTVVLAIIFVVLLIVLIVLLTRKPEKSQEISESYY